MATALPVGRYCALDVNRGGGPSVRRSAVGWQQRLCRWNKSVPILAGLVLGGFLASDRDFRRSLGTGTGDDEQYCSEWNRFDDADSAASSAVSLVQHWRYFLERVMPK